jgi:hypothetical protein
MENSQWRRLPAPNEPGGTCGRPGNLADLTHPSFARPPVPYALKTDQTNKASLEAAVEAATEWLGRAVKPVLLAGTSETWRSAARTVLCMGGLVGGLLQGVRQP